MTVKEAVEKYGQNDATVINFVTFLLLISKLSVDPSEIDTFVGLVQNILGAPYALYFLESVVTSENISMFTDRIYPVINDSSTLSENITIVKT